VRLNVHIMNMRKETMIVAEYNMSFIDLIKEISAFVSTTKEGERCLAIDMCTN
jgi:hypothetical protein